MFSFLVKRILSGFMIVVLVSMMVYALFWYGPKSPALELCRRDTNNRCTPAKLVEFEDRLGYNNSIVTRVRQVGQGPGPGPHDQPRHHRVRLPRALPRPVLPGQDAGHRIAQGPLPDHAESCGRCVLPLPVDRRHHRRARRTKTWDRRRQGVGRVDACLQLHPLLPGRAAELPDTHAQHQRLPGRRSTSRSSTIRCNGSPACCWCGWSWACTARRRTPGTHAAR